METKQFDPKNLLPPIQMYSKFLAKASAMFGLTLNECRNKYGSFSINEWEQLLKL